MVGVRSAALYGRLERPTRIVVAGGRNECRREHSEFLRQGHEGPVGVWSLNTIAFATTRFGAMLFERVPTGGEPGTT